jgi:hypothetical protein
MAAGGLAAAVTAAFSAEALVPVLGARISRACSLMFAPLAPVVP